LKSVIAESPYALLVERRASPPGRERDAGRSTE
jgi:hypothetical protein